MKIDIASITVNGRHRRDMGDLGALAESIRTLGLLQPIGVTSAYELVWGERRLRACKMLGMKEIEAKVDPSFDDVIRAMKAEEQENTCRKPLTHSEAVTVAKGIEEFERAEATKRRDDGRKSGGRGHKKLPEESAGSSGESRNKVAAAVGLSHDTLKKAATVVDKGHEQLTTMMDRGEISVDAAAQIATLPADKQEKVIAGGAAEIAKAARVVREKKKQDATAARLKSDPCEVVAERWSDSLHAALVPLNSVRGDLGGGKEWARLFDKKTLTVMANQLRLVVEGYQDWLDDVMEVLNEHAS